MLKIRMSRRDGSPIILLGLSRTNVDRLMTDQPIRFDLKEVGLEGEMIIVGGNDERSIIAQLVEFGILPGSALAEYRDLGPGESWSST